MTDNLKPCPLCGHMDVDDPRLTATERAALERCLVGPRKGGEGWHRESTDGLQARAILDAGETRDDSDVKLLETALRLAARAGKLGS